MSNYTTRATAILTMNTDQIKAEIPATVERINKLKKALADAVAAGHTGLARQLRKDLRDAQKDLKMMESAVNDVARVMKNLDTASPKQLNAALKQLNRELQNMERGTAAWNAQVEKIRLVKAELVKVNTSLVEQDGLWTRFSKKMFQMGNAIFAATAAATALIQAGRSAVNAYASMEEQMTNTVKYTGMAREEVEKMNEAFVGLNSRLTREKMNEFAQEAGRLGKNTREAVQGYVEAANILSVALVDLGEGATQEIAKLTNIFGVEEALGTRDAMLSVGSAVNVLSQNCTASKPYLVEFTKRLGGIGAQANMTIQEILAFGATLDANGQKVEMSASALSRLIMMLFQKPGEIAQKVGLDMQQFTDTLNRSTNEGIIMFLDKLHEMGEKNALAALSPLFKDLGMDGIRMAQVLASLAQHIDMVKWEQVEANKAFSEATSATREYELFNNTAQAGIEKARNRVHELAVSLGQQLLPIMRHIYTSSGAMLRLLNMIVGFVKEYKYAFIGATSALIAYNAAVKVANTVNFMLLRTYTLKMTLLRGLVILKKAKTAAMVEARAAALALRTAYFYLTGNIVRMKYALSELQLLMTRTNPWGLAAAAVAALITLIVKLIPKQNEFTKSLRETIETAKGLNAEYRKEQHELDILWGKLKAARKGSDEYKAIKDQILKQYRPYLEGLVDENGEITNLAAAYDRLTLAIRRSARERGIAAAREKAEQSYYDQLSKDLGRLQKELERVGVSAVEASELVAKVSEAVTNNKALDKNTADRLTEIYKNRGRTIQTMFSPGNSIKGIIGTIAGNTAEFNRASRAFDAMQDQAHPLRNVSTEDLSRQINALDRKILENNKRTGKGEQTLDIVTVVYTAGDSVGTEKWLKQSDAIKLRDQLKEELALRIGQEGKGRNPKEDGGYTKAPTAPVTTSGGGRSGKGSEGHEDKFAAEKAWREREEALNEIAYRTGERNFQRYTERMLEIERDFYQMQLKHTDLGETERLKILAQYHEATQKMQRQYGTTAIEEEDAEYAIRLAELKQYYLDGVIEVEAYNGKVKEMELQHLAQVAEIRRSFAEAHPEDAEAMKAYVKAQDAYQKMIIQDQQEKQKAYEAQLKEHQKQMSNIWDKYFVSDKEKRQQQYNQALALVEEAYREEIAKEGYTAEEKLEIERRYQEALKKLREEFLKDDSWQNKSMEDYMGDLFKKIFPDADWEKWRPALENMYASVSSVYQSLTQMAEAEEQIRLANMKKRYDAEISMAEGNAYKVKELEKKRTKEEAKIKAEASKRQFAQQVVSALAQTATAALNAYSSTAAIPIVGPTLAPIAAAVAVAAGMLQVAAIKKQQAASLAQGYAQGGFTPAGRPDEPVGVVHAGEWVASQKLLQNPQAKAAIDTLDYAQRNNAFGVLKGKDVSRQITAPSVMAQAQPQVIINSDQELLEVISRLNERLNTPFVTVNTVTGDVGMKRAQDDYQALINNTLPKSKRR